MSMSNAPALSANSYTFFTGPEYFRDLARRIQSVKPGGRVLLTAMTCDPAEPVITAVLDALEAAALRNVRVFFAIDAHGFMTDEKLFGPLWWHKDLPQNLQGLAARNDALIERLRAAGVKCSITNMPSHAFSNPFKGRSHIKVAVIDDFVYVGGCNLRFVDQIDCMVGWRDIVSADWLFETMRALVETGNTQLAFGITDKQFQPQTNTQLLLDVGVKKQSIILDYALELIDNAQQWVFLSCQYFPIGVTAKHLRAAHKRGVRVFLLLNNLAQHRDSSVHLVIENVVTAIEKRRLPASFFNVIVDPKLPYLHAKVLASERESIVGSHNFVSSGVNFGTAELAFHNTDPEFGRRAVMCVLKQTNFADDSRFEFLKSVENEPADRQ